MDKLLYYKNEFAQLSAKYYLCNPYNSLGKEKSRKRKYPNLYFGPLNKETSALVKSLFSNRRKTFWQKIIDAAEKERQKQMIPIILYRLEKPKDGEYIDKNPLTEEEFRALLVHEKAPNK